MMGPEVPGVLEAPASRAFLPKLYKVHDDLLMNRIMLCGCACLGVCLPLALVAAAQCERLPVDSMILPLSAQ